MSPDDEIAVLKADRQNLHNRVRELMAHNENLHEKMASLKVVTIGDAGYYVHADVKAEIESLRGQLQTEKEITANLVWAAENGIRT